MERNSLLAHGSSFFVTRYIVKLFWQVLCKLKSHLLLICTALIIIQIFLQCRVCTKHGSLISPVLLQPNVSESTIIQDQNEWTCKYCKEDISISITSMLYVFRYLIAELAAIRFIFGGEVT